MLSKLHRTNKGFTLIELMIVVVIIGILAALAIPRFMASTTKSKQSEAKQILKQIYTMQRTYFQEHGVYGNLNETATAGDQFDEIGVEISTEAQYSYEVVSDTTGVRVEATANIDDDAYEDKWQIDMNGQLKVVQDDVTNVDAS